MRIRSSFLSKRDPVFEKNGLMNSDLVKRRSNIFKNNFVTMIPSAPKKSTDTRDCVIPMFTIPPFFAKNDRKCSNKGVKISNISPKRNGIEISVVDTTTVENMINVFF